MKAVVFHGVGDIRMDDVPEPRIEDPTDAVVRITASAICGTDLHFVRGTVPGMMPGTVLGHEGVGVVEEVGPGVRNFKRGRPRGHRFDDRVRFVRVLPRRLLRAVRHGEPERAARGHCVLRRPCGRGCVSRHAGRARARAVCTRRHGAAARRGERRSGDPALGHLSDRLVRRRARRGRARRHGRGVRLRTGRAVRDSEREAARARDASSRSI